MPKCLRKIRYSFFRLGKVPFSHLETFFFPLEIFISKSFKGEQIDMIFKMCRYQSCKEDARIKCTVLQLCTLFIPCIRVRWKPAHTACGLATKDTCGSFNYCLIFNVTLSNCHEEMHRTANVSFQQHYISEIIVGEI